MPLIAIEVSDKDALNELNQLVQTEDDLTIERQGMNGVSLYSLILTLAPLVIPAVVKIVLAQIAAKKHVRVVVDGIEIQGVSEETLLKLLDKSK